MSRVWFADRYGRTRSMEFVKRSRYGGYYGGAAAGPIVYNPLRARTGRKRYSRRKSYARTGRYRKAGYFGRFGTGRGPRAQVEKKFIDTPFAGTADTTLEPLGSITNIPQGATQGQRIGYKCIVKSIQWRANWTLPAGASSNDKIFLWIVQDTQTNGAQASTTDVWTNTVASTALRNIQNGDRFKCLHRESIDLNANAGVAAAFDGDYQTTEGFMKCNIPLVFSGATGVITEQKTNSIGLYLGSSITDDVIQYNISTRLRFTDK